MKSPSLVWLLALILWQFSASAQNFRQGVEEGNEHYQKEAYDEAELSYRKALNMEETKHLAKAEYNLGAALLRQKRYGEGREALERSIQQSGDQAGLRAKAWHNIGNSYLEEENWQQAAESFKKALRANPQDDESRYNLARALSRLQQQQQQQENQNQDQDQKKEQEKQEQKKEGGEDSEPSPEQQDQKGDQDSESQQPEKSSGENQGAPQISREDAERLLKALEEDEEKLQKDLMKKKIKIEPQPGVKDW